MSIGCSTGTNQQGEHLQHGDLSVDQVCQEVDEGGDAKPVTKTRANGGAHQSALPLRQAHTQSSEATAERKNSYLTGRNLHQNQHQEGQPSASTGRG